MLLKLYNVITLGQHYYLATIFYLGIGLILYGITPSQTSYLYAEDSGCGGEVACEAGESCCDGSCCSGVCCSGECYPAGTICCDEGNPCGSGQQCCHGNCISENAECCGDGTAGECGCCKPTPEAEKTTAIDCSE